MSDFLLVKICGYCGHENSDEAIHCSDCSSSDLGDSVSRPSPALDQEKVPQVQLLPRDRPKIVIVIGIWALYLPGLIVGILVLWAILSGALGAKNPMPFIVLPVGGIAYCVYNLYRATLNYRIHKQRSAEEKNF